MLSESEVLEILRTKSDGRLFHRESQELEFKEQFNFAGLAEYFRDFAAFANNRGGVILFGVTDSPRVPAGLSESALEQFEKIDPARIEGHLLEVLSPAVDWSQAVFEVGGSSFGVFKVQEARAKPVIARRDEGKGPVIRGGEIYYRYGGRTQKIEFAELEGLIRQRLERQNREWRDLVQKISAAGPENAAILDLDSAQIQKHDARIMVVDDALAQKLKFIREGEFEERDGAPTLKLIGDVVPVEQVEVVRRVRENLTRQYPLSAMELAAAVEERLPGAKRNDIWDVIRENGLKENRDYSAFNFRNKKQEDEYREIGTLPKVTPSIYNHRAVEFIVKILRDRRDDA